MWLLINFLLKVKFFIFLANFDDEVRVDFFKCLIIYQSVRYEFVFSKCYKCFFRLSRKKNLFSPKIQKKHDEKKNSKHNVAFSYTFIFCTT